VDEASERRVKYFEDVSSVVDRHRARGFEYEKEAIAYSTSALKVLSYLNGGGLLAMPAAVTLFHTSIDKVKFLLLGGAGSFVAGLLFVAISQGCAFFTMAKRSESQNHFADEQTLLLNMVHYPEVGDQKSMRTEATENRQAANRKVAASDKWRFAGVRFWHSTLDASWARSRSCLDFLPSRLALRNLPAGKWRGPGRYMLWSARVYSSSKYFIGRWSKRSSTAKSAGRKN